MFKPKLFGGRNVFLRGVYGESGSFFEEKFKTYDLGTVIESNRFDGYGGTT